MTGSCERVEAEIVFEVVNTPIGEAFCVDKFVVKASGISGAGHCSGAGIHTEFKPL